MNKVIEIGLGDQLIACSQYENGDRAFAIAPNLNNAPDKSNMVILRFSSIDAAEKVVDCLKGLIVEWTLDNLLAEI